MQEKGNWGTNGCFFLPPFPWFIIEALSLPLARRPSPHWAVGGTDRSETSELLSDPFVHRRGVKVRRDTVVGDFTPSFRRVRAGRLGDLISVWRNVLFRTEPIFPLISPCNLLHLFSSNETEDMPFSPIFPPLPRSNATKR